MTALPPRLFDPDLLARRRARAAAGGFRADFLHESVAKEATERLEEVNRRFTAPAVVGPRGELWAAALKRAGLPEPRLVPDAEMLDLEPEAHDLVIHALALHWANDPVGRLVQCRRALRPDGLLLAASFGGATLAELRAALAEAEVAEMGGLSPRVAPMAEIRDLGSLLGRAGLDLPVADGQRLTVSYADAFALMHDLRAMGETNVLGERLRRPTRAAVFAKAAAIYAERFGTGEGRVLATFEVIWLAGWAPAASQPKPLRPGSAVRRLANALGTEERPAGAKAAGVEGPRDGD